MSTASKTLQELIVAAHFQAPFQLSVLDLADWVGHFADYPVIQQLPVLPPLSMPVVGPQQFTQVLLPMDGLPRMLLRTGDGRFSVQLQGDRFAFGWRRTEPLGELADYPGFDEFEQKWQDTWGHFEIWTNRRFGLRPPERLMELTYANAAPLEEGGKKKRLSEIFKFVQATGRPVSSFNVNWTESIYERDGPAPKGIVNTSVAIGMAAPAATVLVFNFSGLASLAPGEKSKQILSDIHGKIREIYESAVVSDAV